MRPNIHPPKIHKLALHTQGAPHIHDQLNQELTLHNEGAPHMEASWPKANAQTQRAMEALCAAGVFGWHFSSWQLKRVHVTTLLSSQDISLPVGRAWPWQ